MERVAFLIEETGAQLTCLLNPEALEQRRAAGFASRRHAGGLIVGDARADDPVIATGGGITELDLMLLFDADVAQETASGAATTVRPRSIDEPALTLNAASPGTPTPSSVPPRAVSVPPEERAAPSRATPPFDVRTLTGPFWALAENGEGDHPAPPVVRFIWGKVWNVPAIVLFVAERLELFDADGLPRRSWLSLRLRRVDLAQARASQGSASTADRGGGSAGGSGSMSRTIPLDDRGGPMERLDQVAAARYGNPELAWPLAARNGIDDALTLATGNAAGVRRSAQIVLPDEAALANAL